MLFLAQHSVATLLRHCFEWLQHCFNIAALFCAKKLSLRIVLCNITLKGLCDGCLVRSIVSVYVWGQGWAPLVTSLPSSCYMTRLILLAYCAKCTRTPLNLKSKGPYSSSQSEIKFRRCLFTFTIKHEIGYFHVVVTQKRQRNVQKRVMHVQSCCFVH